MFCQYLQIKLMLHLLLFYPSTWFICDFFLFHIEIEENVGGLLGGQRVCWSPFQIIEGPAPHLLPTPMLTR